MPERPSRSASSVPTRRRRTAAESRRRILEAAQRRLVASGPEGLRLQELAADLGLSHPAILHHFGSREGLLRALAAHGVARLNEEIARRVRDEDVDLREILELTAETLADRGQARLLAWLALSGRTPRGDAAEDRPLRSLSEVAHAARSRHRAAEGRPPVDYEDTAFAVALVGLALLGDALLGDRVREDLGLDDPEAPARFRAWLAALLETHLSGGGKSPPA